MRDLKDAGSESGMTFYFCYSDHSYRFMNIAIIYSLPTTRAKKSSYLIADEDTVVSAGKIASALESKGVTTQLVGISEEYIHQAIHSIHADLIINLIDWTGSDLPLSYIAMEELTNCGIPFAGATKENFMLVDKVNMKHALDAHHIPCPTWQVFTTGDEPISPTFTFPVLVKLSQDHCSVGIEKTSFVKTKDALRAVVKDRIRRFSQRVFAEEFVSGREFQITVLEEAGGPVMLPPAEIVYKPTGREEFLTFSERWDENDPDYLRSNTILAALSNEQILAFETVCMQTFRELEFRDFTRIDARLNTRGELLVLEANPNPGLDDDELYSMTISARAVGLTFPDFLWKIVESAMRR